MKIDTTYVVRCISTLQRAQELLLSADKDSIDYDMYRSACIKEFEIILEQCGKLLRKTLKPYFDSTRQADQLTFKDIFRNAVLRSIIDNESCERWFLYRDVRNNTAHDYGVNFADETLAILSQFVRDASQLTDGIEQLNKK